MLQLFVLGIICLIQSLNPVWLPGYNSTYSEALVHWLSTSKVEVLEPIAILRFPTQAIGIQT